MPGWRRTYPPKWKGISPPNTKTLCVVHMKGERMLIGMFGGYDIKTKTYKVYQRRDTTPSGGIGKMSMPVEIPLSEIIEVNQAELTRGQ